MKIDVDKEIIRINEIYVKINELLDGVKKLCAENASLLPDHDLKEIFDMKPMPLISKEDLDE